MYQNSLSKALSTIYPFCDWTGLKDPRKSGNEKLLHFQIENLFPNEHISPNYRGYRK